MEKKWNQLHPGGLDKYSSTPCCLGLTGAHSTGVVLLRAPAHERELLLRKEVVLAPCWLGFGLFSHQSFWSGVRKEIRRNALMSAFSDGGANNSTHSLGKGKVHPYYILVTYQPPLLPTCLSHCPFANLQLFERKSRRNSLVIFAAICSS